MKKIISLLLVACMLLAIAVSLTGCGAPKDSGASIDIYLGSSVYDLDPTDYYVDSNAEMLMSLIYEPLFKVVDGKLECAMAEDYVVDREERTIVITLRESYWSNNTRVKAADFVYAWTERLLDPANPNPAAALLYDIENAAALKGGQASPADVKVEATDIYELTITYREGADYKQLLKNLASVATSPMRQPTDPSILGYWSKSLATILTNGAFRLASYDALGLTLTRNKGYHQPFDIEDYDNEVNPGELVAFTTPLGEEIELGYKDIENKVCFFLTDAPLDDRSANKDKATLVDDTSVYSYVFNTRNPLFADAKVRQALSMVIDREAIINAITYGKAADGFVPDVSGGSDAALISAKADLQGAQQLLAQANLPASVSKSFTLTVANDTESIAIANIVEAAWESLGFNVTVKAVSTVATTVGQGPDAVTFNDSEIQQLVKLASVGEVKFDVIALDWQTYTDDAFVALASLSSNMNGCGRELPNGNERPSITGWVNAEYDALISAAYAAEGEDRAKYLADAEALLCESAPIVPLVFNQTGSFVSKELRKVDFDSFGNVIFTDAKQKNYQKYLEAKEED